MNLPASFLSNDPFRKSASQSIPCRRILGNYLEHQGFTESDATGIDGNLYTRFDLFLQVSLDASGPDCLPSVTLEFGERPCDEEGRLAKVPIWHGLPEKQRTRKQWTFQTEEELETVLLEIRSGLTAASQKHLWLNQDALEETIGKRIKEAVKVSCCVLPGSPAPDGAGFV